MDPASVAIGVVSGAAALAAMAVKTTTFLVGLKDSYKRTDLIILDLASACQAFEIAWVHIRDWANSHSSRATESSPIFEQLSSYLEVSKVVLETLQADLERFGSKVQSSWRSMSRKAVILHEKMLRDHCDRLHRQTSTLHFLLSTARLPSLEMQEVVVELLQPVFRKDEETAWTIVQSRQSVRHSASSISTMSKRPTSSIIALSKRNSLQIHSETETHSRRFVFENDLFLAPVYKRMLFKSLSAPETIKEALEPELDIESTSNVKDEIRPSLPAGREGNVEPNTAGLSPIRKIPEETQSRSDDINLTPENIIKALRDSGNVSVGVQVDLKELQRSTDVFSLPKRSLPLSSLLKRSQMSPEEQNAVNRRLHFGAKAGDIRLVAQALDDGAGINDTSDLGSSTNVLQNALARNESRLISALVLLYNETDIYSRNERGESLLHICVRSGEAEALRRLVKTAEDLEVRDANGVTPLHMAANGGASGLAALKEINRIFALKGIRPDEILDRQKRTALQVAAGRNYGVDGSSDGRHHGVELVRLGCNPFFQASENALSTSPLEIAIKLHKVEFVQAILRACPEETLDHIRFSSKPTDIREYIIDAATKFGQNEIVGSLVRHSATCVEPRLESHEPWVLSGSHDSQDICLLLANNARPPLHAATKAKDFNCAALLFRDGRNWVEARCQGGHEVRLHLKSGEDAKAPAMLKPKELSPFKAAITIKDFKLAADLVRKGEDWTQDYSDYEILTLADSVGDPTLVLTLISKGCFPHADVTVDITNSMPAILRECKSALAIEVFEAIQSKKPFGGCRTIYSRDVFSNRSTEHMLYLDDLLVNVIFRGRLSQAPDRYKNIVAGELRLPLLKESPVDVQLYYVQTPAKFHPGAWGSAAQNSVERIYFTLSSQAKICRYYGRARELLAIYQEHSPQGVAGQQLRQQPSVDILESRTVEGGLCKL